MSQQMVSNKGSPIVIDEVNALIEWYHIDHKKSTPYYPWGNAQEEATKSIVIDTKPYNKGLLQGGEQLRLALLEH